MPPARRKTLASLQDLFGIDSRSLALFRIGIALVVLFDLAVRSADLAVFYTDAGVLPRAALVGQARNEWTLSIHLLNGTAVVQAVLLCLQGACAVGLLLGYRTRWMSVLSWFLMASLQRRNPLILGGADNYLRMMLFWGMFLPLGARYSLDRAFSVAPARPSTRIFSVGTAAILLQTTLVYVMTALYKWRGTTWQDGSALRYAFNLDLYAKAPAAWLLQFPWLLTWLTHAVLWFESLAPWLLFCPAFTRPIRVGLCVCFILMQLGFGALLYLQLFPAVSMAAMLLFLPGSTHAPERAAPWRTSRAANAVAAFFLFLVFFWVSAELMPSSVRMPKPLRRIGTMAYIDQAWRMFAPNPARVSGWLVVPGVLQDGAQVDLSRDGAPVSWEKPPQRLLFKNERWRKYLMHFLLKQDRGVWRGYARYLCRSWNAHHAGEQRLESLDIVLMARHTPPEGEAGPYEKKTLLHDGCGAL